MPASLKKLVVRRLKTFKLAPTKYVGTQTEKFSTPTSLHFLAHRTRSILKEGLYNRSRQLNGYSYKKIRFVVYASRAYLQYEDYNLYAIVKAGAIAIE